mgnify:CR=1 FL=1
MIYRLIVTFLMAFSTLSLAAQKTPSDQILFRTIRAMKKAKSTEDYLPVKDSIQFLVNKHPDQWIYHYYAALTDVFQFNKYHENNVPNSDPNKAAEKKSLSDDYEAAEKSQTGQNLLTKALEKLSAAEKLSQDEEIYVLKAYILFLQFRYSPTQQYATYEKSITAAMEKARTLNPANPRLLYTDALLHYYGPEHVFGGVSSAHAKCQEAAYAFMTGNTERYPFMPNWGAYMLEKFMLEIGAPIPSRQ